MFTALLALLLIAVPVGFGALGLAAVSWHLRRRRQLRSGRATVRRFARRNGLTRTSRWFERRLRYAGAFAGLEVELDLLDAILQARLLGHGQVRYPLSTIFTKEGLSSTDKSTAAALLDGGLRDSLRGSGVRIKIGSESGESTATLDMVVSAETTEGGLQHAIQGLARARDRATSAATIPEMLESRVRDDSNEVVRRDCLEILTSEYGHHPNTQRAMEAAQKSDVPILKFLAAVNMDSRDTLEMLATGASVPGDVREKAIVQISKKLEGTHKLDVLRRAFPLTSGWAQASILLEIVRANDSSVISDLSTLGKIADPAAVGVLTQSLGRLGQTEAILPFLEHPELGARIAATRALGSFGTPEVIPKLRTKLGKLVHPKMRDSAARAIEEIRSRHVLPGAEPGLLSVTGEQRTTGSLALTPQAGALSEPEG